MCNYYTSNPKFCVGIDCIIFGFHNGKIHLLLVQRDFEPAKGQWSLMGGFVQKDESVDDAARRVLTELTGLTDVYMEQVGAFGAIDRDPGERVVSIAYYALINTEAYDRRLVEAHHASWVDIDHLPTLIFDHLQMVGKAGELLRRKTATEPIGLNLLPDLFTIPQLQSLYEAIFGMALDKRNFRKAVLDTGTLEAMHQKDYTNSKRGAMLYRFKKEVYEKAQHFNTGMAPKLLKAKCHVN